MEITSEIQIKILCQYIGQRVTLTNGNTSELLSVNSLNKFILNGLWWTDLKLILKPYSQLSGQDAKTVLQIQNAYPLDCTGGTEKEHLNRCKQIVLNQGLNIRSYQFLLSEGYDLSQHLLGGKNLQEAGLAIYE